MTRRGPHNRDVNPDAKLNFVTGATGLLGSHIAEALRARGQRVRALVRPAGDASFLRELGVEVIPGDLLNLTLIYQAMAGADVVYHCAARIGNWGSWREFRRDVVETTRNVVEACSRARVGRLVHVSSVAVTVVRPSWIYGPRDRNSLPRLVQALRDGWVSLIGAGNNLLNIVYAADVAEGAIRAADSPAGQAFHFCTEGEITQRQFFDTLCDGLGLPRVTKSVSARLASWGGLVGELVARGLGWRRSPHVTQYGTGLLTRPTTYSSSKAQQELGWKPVVTAAEGLHRTLEWFVQQYPHMNPGKMGCVGKNY